MCQVPLLMSQADHINLVPLVRLIPCQCIGDITENLLPPSPDAHIKIHKTDLFHSCLLLALQSFTVLRSKPWLRSTDIAVLPIFGT